MKDNIAFLRIGGRFDVISSLPRLLIGYARGAKAGIFLPKGRVCMCEL